MEITIKGDAKEIAELLATERLIDSKLDEHVKGIVKGEVDHSAWQNLKTTYPPEFVKGLEEVFRGLKCDSRE